MTDEMLFGYAHKLLGKMEEALGEMVGSRDIQEKGVVLQMKGEHEIKHSSLQGDEKTSKKEEKDTRGSWQKGVLD